MKQVKHIVYLMLENRSFDHLLGWLYENGFSSPDSWSVFYNQTWPGVFPDKGHYCYTQDLFWPHLKNFDGHFQSIEKFFTFASKGKLPQF